MTRNTKLHKVSFDGIKTDILYRTLTVNELAFLNNINSVLYRYEQACKLAITEGYDSNMQFNMVAQLGKQIIDNSADIINDKQLLDITIEEFRQTVEQDFSFTLMSHLIGVLPGVSIVELMNMTYTDIIELCVMCEKLFNKKIFKNTNRMNLTGGQDGHQYFPDDGVPLAEKIKQAQKRDI